MNTPVPIDKLHQLYKKFGSRTEFAKRFALSRNPFDYYMLQKNHMDKVKQTPITPVSQRKVKVIKRAIKTMEVS